MSSTIYVSSSSIPNFQPIFEKALEEYKKKTGKDLTDHPLAVEIIACISPQAVITILEGKANELNQSRISDERLTKWLNPTANILNALSTTLGEVAGSVFLPTKIIFSGIGILLAAAKDTVASRDVLVELFDGIGCFFERLKVYTEVPPTQAVTGVLAKTMAEVLLILAIATKGVKERRTKTFLKKLAGMNDIEDALQRLRKLEHGELLMVIAQVSRDTSGLKDDAKETKAMVKEIVDKIDASNWKEVLPKLKGWLTPPDPSTNYTIGLRNLHEETATWFLDDHIFQKWRSTGSLLWIHGKPGSGKSIFCSAIIRRIGSLCGGGRASMAYFYFDFRDDNKKHRHNLLPSLLVQLAAHSIPCCDIIFRVYSEHGNGTQRPSDEVLISCLMDMLSATTQHPIYIIVDALDECPNTSGVRSSRERVLSLIQALVNLHLRNLHICVTSRPEIDIRNRLEPLRPLLVSLHDQLGQKEDIAKYIRSEVDYIANDKRWREGDKEIVTKALSEKADGMFRWVFCQLEMLRLCLRSRVRHLVNDLPDSLDETYERVLREIHKTNQVHVERLLQCLAVAIRPLRVKELAGILTSDSDAIEGKVPTSDADSRSEDQEQELLSACPSLITIVDSDGSRVVQFSHFSVKEFLTSDRLATSSEDISRYRILPDDAHTTLARASLRALLRLDDRTGWWSARRIPLAEYAVKHWAFHAQVGNVSSRVMGLMKTLFDSDKPHFATWVRLYDEDGSPYFLSPPLNDPQPLYYSALWGFYDLVEHLVKKHPEHVNAIGGEYDYPLVAALHGGHIRVAELLFRHGANIDVQGKKKWTPLHRAIEWPYNLASGAVQFLLKQGADVNSRLSDNTTPLHLVSGNLYLKLVRLLIEHDANVNAKNNRGQTPLLQALLPNRNPKARFGVAQLLVERGADVDAQDADHKTPLHLACDELHLEVVRLLVDHDADVNAKNNRGQAPLHRILLYNFDSQVRLGIAQLLVGRGADVDAQDEGHATPLHLACDNLHFKLVHLLVEHGATANARNNRGQTPLHRALLYNFDPQARLGIAQLLIGRGTDVDAQDDGHTTPLHMACDRLHLEVVRLLVDHDADVNVKNNRGHAPLHRILLYNFDFQVRLGIAQLLVGRGANVDAQDNDHKTPLHLATVNLHLESVQLLVEHGANVNARNNRGQTPLHQALWSYYCNNEGDFGIVRLLVGCGADVDAQDEDHTTPLHMACDQLHLESVRFLVEHGADVNAKNNQGQAPLHQALLSNRNSKARFGVAQLLVQHGGDVDAQDKDHDTPLHFASYYSELEFVRVLLDYAANVNAKNKRGQTPLHQALLSDCSSEDSFGVARLLLERGADVDARDEDHDTPLHVASYYSALEFVRVLLDHTANVNAKNKQGRTPLHQALLSEHKSEDCIGIAWLLVERGADVNARDGACETPLHFASQFLDLKLVRFLLDHGANTNVEDDRGRTPLRRALEDEGCTDGVGFRVAQLLMERGADTNRRDDDHETPLHRASRFMWLEVAWILLKHGGDQYAENKEGKIPFQLVQEMMRKEMKRSSSKYSMRRTVRVQGVVLMSLLCGYQYP